MENLSAAWEVTVRSSKKAIFEGLLGNLKRPQHLTSAELTLVFMARAYRMTERVQPIIILFSVGCQSDIPDPAEKFLAYNDCCNLE